MCQQWHSAAPWAVFPACQSGWQLTEQLRLQGATGAEMLEQHRAGPQLEQSCTSTLDSSGCLQPPAWPHQQGVLGPAELSQHPSLVGARGHLRGSSGPTPLLKHKARSPTAACPGPQCPDGFGISAETLPCLPAAFGSTAAAHCRGLRARLSHPTSSLCTARGFQASFLAGFQLVSRKGAEQHIPSAGRL